MPRFPPLFLKKYTSAVCVNYYEKWQACDVLFVIYILGGVKYLIAYIYMPDLKCPLRW